MARSIPCFLVRRSNKEKSQTFNSLGILREDAIMEADLPGLSLNLLGGSFLDHHIKFVPRSKGMSPWKGNSIYFIDYKDDFQTLEICSPIFFSMEAIHHKTFPYYRGNDSEAKKIIKALSLNPKIVDGQNEFYGTTEIVHTPNNLNYWHAEMFLMDQAGNTIKKRDSVWIQSACKLAYGHLISGSALPDQPHLHPIERSFYVA